MHRHRKARKKVLVCCQQGKDRSALVVLAYIMTKWSVLPDEAYNYLQSLRPIVSTKDVPDLWSFLCNGFTAPSLRRSERQATVQSTSHAVAPDIECKRPSKAKQLDLPAPAAARSG